MKLYATAARGTADLVAGELAALGFGGTRWDPGGCWFAPGADGPLAAGMRACLHLRTALRVLWPLASFAAADAEGLYAGARTASWEDFVRPESTFAVLATTSAPPPLAHAPFLAQKVKDAIVDRVRGVGGVRPDVDRARPDTLCYVHVADGQATVGVDLAGRSLHERGYRVDAGPAPLRETLAAAVVLASGWRGERPFLDPMCGSGTLVLEAALHALAIAPGLLGARFGFERWPSFGDAERSAWRALVEEARSRVRARLEHPILGRDRDADALAAAGANLARLPPAVARAVRFEPGDVRQIRPIEPPAAIVTNPPYGERIGGAGAQVFLRTVGQKLRALDGHTAFILAPAEAQAALGMRPTWQRRLMNGPLAVVLARYELGRARATSKAGRS